MYLLHENDVDRLLACSMVLVRLLLGLKVTPRRIVKQEMARTSSIEAAAITRVGTPETRYLIMLRSPILVCKQLRDHLKHLNIQQGWVMPNN